MNRIVRVACLLLLLAVATRAHAQQNVSAALTSTTCPGSGCVTLGVSGVGGVGVQITGTFTATVQFEGSVDGVTYAAMNMTPIASTSAVTSATAGGIWSGGVGGLSVVRVRVSAYTSGTVTVRIQNAPVSARSLVGSGGGGGGTIGGSIAQNQVAFGLSSDTITGSSDFTWDGADLVLNGDLTVNSCTGCGGGGGTPGSPDTSVQFNSGGSFGGSDNLTWVEPVLAVGLDGASSAAATFWAGFPQIFLQEMSGTLTPGFISYVYNSTADYAGGFYPMRSRGTPGSPTAVQSGDNLGVFEPEVYDGSDWATPASFQFRTTQAFTGTNRGTQAVLKLTSDGGSIQDKTYTFGQTLFTTPGGLNAAGGTFTVDGSGNLTVAGCTGCGASAAFSSITSGTNTTAAMVVGTGGSLAATGSGTITATAVPVGGISGLGSGVATFLATPSSANLASALTNETGSGVAVFGTSPTFTTSILGAAGLTVDLGTANEWAQYNSTNAQVAKFFNTRTDASNGEWFNLRWASNVMHVGVTKNGTGTARVMSLDFGDGSTSAISIPAASGAISFGGAVTLPNGAAGNSTLRFAGSDVGFYNGTSGFVGVTGTGVARILLGGSFGQIGLLLNSNNYGLYIGDSLDVGISRVSAGLIEINNGTASTYRDLKLRQLYPDQTITAGGTTGNQTINKAAGTVNFAASATSLTVTDSLVTTSSTIYTMPRTNDATCTVKNVVPSAGSFVITMTAGCTAETSVGFVVLN